KNTTKHEIEIEEEEHVIESNKLMGSVRQNFILTQIEDKNIIENNNDISVKGFSITTNGGQELFKNAELILSYGRRYGLIGPNGKGKTTLLRHIGEHLFKIPSNIDIFYCEQEVVADDTSAVQVVLKSDLR
ncbi:MAG: ATP-binding cassette sub- F member 1, partial [Paramarteilia canceri]